ncbi:UDP-N-acetylmuramoyl-tripeptide--D-alanyl-D-alanine ligase [Acidocella aminolytica]|uniref:UDP-N-acetylmuramoyl-tripeptide--D-alanyl-D-alanine ligase n=1 Tax=Acidocella aminolytica 101 = DSM 11237 TaxID=1120923 RepID=A0A0D6PEA4_9PROT|nr:UDP-N-acetylmuramoyl-tripeptide--D-alanyl-D-alanine ligase [Acidocella aminolytica]GAN79179.1 UDP-N-acetylmuramoyl-tripeptide--D-alanyl-D-alanine ligase [Acidocella aminolytica 101 = DSM 11237]GBQ40764.1 UDP-N-acetylmuramoyl-tripeptide--D-alanyl-D-alanine ligase [Acidocella aminolytica 101 = DSM 11237]SHE91263.1 UDP-N-acetylmuramoyl-tripeptide--D-alanyl-D-alanine ligase [Acidocella aminolytica 101 = DSM 11237]
MSGLWTADELKVLFGAGWDVSGISIDTRTLKAGDLFVALSGARDGHEFVAEAFAKGAAAALVSRPVSGQAIMVPDVLKALETLGQAARVRSGAKAVAVTGSVGKTTVKEMLRRTLSAFGKVHAAEASFNNHIGVPLTLARMPQETEFGIFEIGMNHPGEIAPLAALVRPDVAIVTCVDRAHLGLMGSELAIAKEKASIYAALAPAGKAVLPGDTAYVQVLREAVPAGHCALLFNGPEARLLDVLSGPENAEVAAEILGRKVCFRLAAPGRHMASNALAVLTTAAALGLDVEKAADALSGFAPYAGRGARRMLALPGGGQILLLDESYNASGASMRAAFSVLKLQPGRHVAVLGDMLELGEHAQVEHLALAPGLRDAADIVFTAGPHCGALFDSLPRAIQGAHAPDAVTLAPMVQAALRDGDAVLVKGSLGSRMRDVISALESPG